MTYLPTQISDVICECFLATYLAVYLFTGYFFSRTTKHKPVSLRTINCAHKHRPLSTYGISWIQRDMTKMSNMFQDCINMVSWILIVWGTSINDVRRFWTIYFECIWQYRHSSISAVSISAIFNLLRFIILSYFPPL